jgi:hypothetical protein
METKQEIPEIKTLNDSFKSFLRLVPTEGGDVPFLKDIWNFFGVKGTKTVFLSINPEKSFWVDLEVCESLGCPIHILTNSEVVEKKWEIVSKTLKARKIEEADGELQWLKGVEKKWILTKNIKLNRTEFSWNTLKNVANESKLDRIDLLKVEAGTEEERVLLYSMIDSGYRPGVLLVKYTTDPDNAVPPMLLAGHLQMIGYRLLSCVNNWFMYMYQDFCLYDSCSWRNTLVQNPVVASLFEVFSEQGQAKQQGQEGQQEQQGQAEPKTQN